MSVVATLIAAAFGWSASDDSAAGLLHRDDVQAELKLTSAQIKKLDAIDRPPKVKTAGSFESDPISISDPDVEDRRNEQRESKVWGILSPGQGVRLLELLVQRQGVKSLLRSDIQVSLGLSDDQIAQVRQAKSRHDMAVKELMQKVASTKSQIGRLDPKKVGDVQKSIEKRLIEDLDQVPDQAQRNKLTELGGKKFTFFEPRYGS